MSVVKPSYEELEDRLGELEGLFAAIRSGEVDSVVSDRDPSRLLILREYELELQRERQLAELQAILETVPTALAIVRPEGEICLSNRAFCFAGCIDSTNRTSCGVSCPGRCTTLEQWAARLQAHAEFPDVLKQHLAESLEGSRQSDPMETSFRTYAGDQLHWLMTFQQLPGEIEGRPAVIMAGTDVTDEKCLIDQLSDAKAQMEDFLAAAAHDLKSPLITIAHNATFARMGQGDTIMPEAAECLDRIQAAEKDMLNLLNQISAVSRAGRDTEPRKRHALHELVQSALRQLEGMLAQHRAEVVVGDGFPELYCQGTKLVQVFSNLISNAIKYTPTRRRPHIEVGYRLRRGPEHLFFVSDNGSGIPEEGLQRIFGLFDRLSADPNIPGQGVGLTVVRRIVELHGGRIWAESAEGKGSTFYFTIGRQRRDDHVCDN